MVAPLVALTSGTLLNLILTGLGLGGRSDFVPFVLGWAVAGLLGWRILKVLGQRETAEPHSGRRRLSSASLVNTLAWAWLIGGGFLSFLLGAFATDSESAESKSTAAGVILVGWIVASGPLLWLKFRRG